MAPISVPKMMVRALTVSETEQIVGKIRTDPEAQRLDLVDLVEFMLGMGVRLGEACVANSDAAKVLDRSVSEH